MLNVKFNNGMSIDLNEQALVEIMTVYFGQETTFLQPEDSSLEVSLLEKEVVEGNTPVEPKVETEEEPTEEPKPKRRKRRTKAEIEADAKAEEAEEEPKKEETPPQESPVVEEEELTTSSTVQPEERDLLQEAIDETPLVEEEPVGELVTEEAPLATDEIDLGRPLFT